MRILPGAAVAVTFLVALAFAGGLCLAQEEAAEDTSREPAYGSEYVIGVEDLLQISVWKNPDLSMNVPVRPDGKISLPLIDDVQAAGRTPNELKQELTERWGTYLSAPEVSVIVTEINSFKVYLVGEVAHPGELRLKGPTRLIQALSLAGGFTTFADPGKIVLLRSKDGSEYRFEINFKKVVSGQRPEDNFELHPGDTIYVP